MREDFLRSCSCSGADDFLGAAAEVTVEAAALAVAAAPEAAATAASLTAAAPFFKALAEEDMAKAVGVVGTKADVRPRRKRVARRAGRRPSVRTAAEISTTRIVPVVAVCCERGWGMRGCCCVVLLGVLRKE